VHFVKIIIEKEIKETTNPSVIFRDDTIATKCVDSYMNIVGNEYLKYVLQNSINEIINSKKSCELDPTRLDPKLKDKMQKVISRNMKHLTKYVTMILENINNSLNRCPVSFRYIFEHIKKNISRNFPENELVHYRGPSGFIFLRFFCPAILAPNRYGITYGRPEPHSSRNLLLAAKVIQNIANFQPFDKKEAYLGCVGDFISSKFPFMKDYLDNLCISPTGAIDSILSTPNINFGREMSMVHFYVQNLIPLLKEEFGEEDKDVIDIEKSIQDMDQEIVIEKQDHSRTILTFKKITKKKRKRFLSTEFKIDTKDIYRFEPSEPYQVPLKVEDPILITETKEETKL